MVNKKLLRFIVQECAGIAELQVEWRGREITLQSSTSHSTIRSGRFRHIVCYFLNNSLFLRDIIVLSITGNQ
jgi:hypothetical protein